MYRRLAALVLSVALSLTAMAAAPCVGRASCAMASARQRDCCSQQSGIATPRCCGEQRMQRPATPATLERPAPPALAANAPYLAAIPPLVAPANSVLVRSHAAGADPPGGTLVAQHTSLLL
jgi:hypothetical protein